jgi:hypothetical protein
MEDDTRGRYRRSRAGRSASRRVSAVVAALALAAGVLLLLPGTVTPTATVEPTTLTGPEPNPGRSELGSRSLGRPAAGEHGLPNPAPTQVADATLTSPLVNGRRQPEPIEPPTSASGRYVVVPGNSSAPSDDAGRVVRYLVEVEAGLPFDPDEFAETVHRILNDARGWANDGTRFKRVDEGSVAFRVSLSSPDLTDAECHPLRTRGQVSCWNGQRAVINALRWGSGADTYGADLLGYREYLINHEVGHALGHGHVNCPDEGEPAPVMVQQTKSLEGCVANPWPFP